MKIEHGHNQYAESINHDIENTIKKSEYLTEKKLGEVLIDLYPNQTFIHNKAVPGSGIKHRPDYRNDELMLIVEFDGHYHFTDPKTIFRDNIKHATYTKMGYKIISIPYFIQLDVDTVNHFFGISDYYSKEIIFPHGFVTKNAVLPAHYCSLGLIKFHKIWNDFFENEFLGEWCLLRNIWLQTVVYKRNPYIVFDCDYVDNNINLFKEIIEYGYPT